MKATIPFDRHPDADLLNGYVEQVLTKSERQDVVAHLSSCARCREIVFLAQQTAEEESPAAVPAKVPATPWLAGWRLVWAGGFASATLAGVLLAALLLRPKPAPENKDVAGVRPPVTAAVPLPPPQQEPQRSTQQPAPLPRTPRAKPVVPPLERSAIAPPPAAAKPPSGQVMGAMAGGAIGMERRSQNASDMGAVGAIAGTAAAPAKVMPRNSVQLASPAIHGAPMPLPQNFRARSLAGRPAGSGQAVALPADQKGQVLQAPQAPQQSLGAASDTVTVTSAAVQAESVEVNALTDLPAGKKKSKPLPSGLAAVSSVADGHRVLAIDASGALFLSKNQGRHWDAIPRQWSGVAVRVEIPAPAEDKAKASKHTKFELVTDTGAIWTSPDGKEWRPR